MRKPTRRQAFLLTSAAVPALPKPPVQAKSAGGELDAARKAVAQSAEQMARVDVKAEVEPAFVFRPY